MVGKARSSNFTLSEKLDLLKLVKPYVKILEEHTNKHSVIVEKNRCWDIIAVNYNAIGVDRPPRTAQGLRTLYKRLKEYAKQELLQQKETQSDFKSNISEPTKKVMEMIPQISSFCLVRDRNHIQSANLDEEAQAGTSSLQVMLDHRPVAITVEVKQEEDIHSAPKEITVSKGQEEEPASLVKYFSVVWCKASKKKHKKWEGDAILIVKGKSFTLKNLDGKDIGRGIGYKFKELEKIEEGQTMMIGGKEIEVMGVISPDDFSSGRCFQLGGKSPAISSFSQTIKKCFSNPLKSVCKPSSKENRQNSFQNCKPRHDPYAPNSLVMLRPDDNHQWMFNKNCFAIVDVVIDPHLVRHLRPHQKEGIIFLYECVMGMRVNGRCGAILADEMGLGKTLQCISLIWTLQCQGPYGGKPVIKKTLIVTPGSLVNNWRKEFQKWLGSERIKIFTVDQDHKIEEFTKSSFYSVLIISYEMLLRSLDQIKNIKFDLLICDEGHRLKNSAIKTTTALISLSCEKRIILTGTPIQNDLQEFFALIDFVNPGILGSLSSYRKIYEEPIIISRQPSASEEEKELGERRAAELTCLTGLFILRRTQEVVNKYLPPKIENVVFCRPGTLQIALYRKLLNSQAVRFCLQGLLENSPHLICIGALKKLCNHPCLLFSSIKEKECSSTWDKNEERSLYEGLINVFPADYNPLMFTEEESGKLQVLSKLLSVIHELRPTEKVVLVSNYTQTLNILQEVCKRHGYAYTRLDGQTPISQRQQIVDGFNSKYSSDFIFLLSSKAGGVGLNLIGGSHLILYDIDWNPATDIQAMSRVWRDGQKHPVHIYRLLTTGTIEEKIYQRQISKQGLSGAVVDLTKTSEHIQFSVEELKNLFTLHESSRCVTHDLLDCECTGEKDHTGDSLEKFSVSRNCQLGPHQQKSDSLKPLSMSQLKQWKHFSGDHLNLTDPFLERIRENVSFFFQNITNQTTAM
ncbi:PREDICTED: DNA repair and recombination protein RAD54B isoform X2 [Ceratotherium simum simum]|uniref:DNA repair and recombination protein RAD54B isoform X2 n=1 Tax=Ceratotherium simum simum TaxID=73337 RepID=A0ABM1CVG6_CERSS|nr:PREDICTED: DNA repair and recombination protein RAD54B isoform X2 [Ceratotherium simum simum]